MGYAMYGNDLIISHLGREKRNYKGFATNPPQFSQTHNIVCHLYVKKEYSVVQWVQGPRRGP
jgi:hypothetical protein